MSGETSRLLRLAKQINSKPTPRESDVLLSTGEQVTISLLSMALHERGCAARSYAGGQVTILTNNAYSKARIIDVDINKIREDLNLARIFVIAGFQGIDSDGNITTLGRR